MVCPGPFHQGHLDVKQRAKAILIAAGCKVQCAAQMDDHRNTV